MSHAPDFATARDHVRRELVEFLGTLREAGVSVPANAATPAARALVAVGLEDEETVRAALRAAVVTDADDVATFDRLFSEFWRRLRAAIDGEAAPRRDDVPDGSLAPLVGDDDDDADVRSPSLDRGPDAADGVDKNRSEASAETFDVTSTALEATGASTADDEERAAIEAAWYSPTGRATEVEHGAAAEPSLSTAFDAFGDALATLRGRRWRTGGTERADARSALRSSFGTGGTVVSVPRRSRPATAHRALWLVDVSRSVLDTVERSFLLGVLRHARVEWRDSRVVFFDEDARELSTAFDEPSAAAALEALDEAGTEWGGGTRIGESIGGLRADEPDAVDGRTVVFVVSDGLETGDVDRLERELAWLSRRAASVLWLNPLASSPDYEPAAAGMAAALPFVDGLFAFRGPADLAELGRQLRRHGSGGPVGYEYDPRREARDTSGREASDT